jgi:hypothetical protein
MSSMKSFEEAERLARRTKKSRGRLLTDAVPEYVACPEKITRAMGVAIAEIDADDDGFVTAAARRILKKSEWRESS